MTRNQKTIYECSECGAQSPKWLGRCNACMAWSSLSEVVQRPGAGGSRSTRRDSGDQVLELDAVDDSAELRGSTGIGEFDRVLGGGLVAGSVVLIGGDPGIGKSTLVMQAMLAMASAGRRVLYVTGEESASQVASRARRLGGVGGGKGARLLATTELEAAEAALAASPYDAVVIDSIQTLRAQGLESSPGSVAQLREVSSRLIDVAKQRDTAMLLIGHVTKDGGLAGPKVLEHLVDVVLSFEGDATHCHRLLRGQKNRFGPTQEVGIFEMVSEGLREVADPAEVFVAERSEQAAGSVVVPSAEGSRPLLVEVQALVAPAQFGSPRRVVSGLDSSRLAVLLAVLARKADVPILDYDVFAAVAGGARVEEPAIDLALCAAIVSALRERALEAGLSCFGEVGLTGELRSVPRAGARLAELRKLGFKQVVLPKAAAARLTAKEREGLELIAVERLEQALEHLLP
ncbi:MAG: DNA repair protein RadA [Myxococcales bacterium]|nr:DNA repair protein RadA [Myxococcales bacterium]